MLVVLPVFFALRQTPLWIPWLLAASYFFYAWWNPLYLLLVVYSTALDYLLVTFMDHCPPEEDVHGLRALPRRGPRDGSAEDLASSSPPRWRCVLVAAAIFLPDSLRPDFHRLCGARLSDGGGSLVIEPPALALHQHIQ